MRKGYPRELREKALGSLKKEMSLRKVKKMLDICVFALQKWINL